MYDERDVELNLEGIYEVGILYNGIEWIVMRVFDF